VGFGNGWLWGGRVEILVDGVGIIGRLRGKENPCVGRGFVDTIFILIIYLDLFQI